MDVSKVLGCIGWQHFGNLLNTKRSDKASVVYEREELVVVGKYARGSNGEQTAGIYRFFTTVDRIDNLHFFQFKQSSIYIPRRELTLAERVEIIREHQRSVRTGLIAQQFRCSKQQVRRIIHRKDEYLALWAKSTNEEVEMVRRLRTPLLIATGRILYEWVLRARYYMDITDDALRESGRAIAAHIKYKDFKSNNRWLGRFKNKYKLHNMKLKNLHRGALDPKHLKPLDIADIIETIKREDPASLADFEKETESVELPLEGIELQNEELLLDPAEDDDRGSSPYDQGIGMDDIPMENGFVENGEDLEFAKEISTYKEAINLLGPIEQFVLVKENIRAVGLINQLENLFRDEIAKGKE